MSTSTSLPPAAQPAANVETGHSDMIHDAQFDYYSKRLATCSSDRLIKVYDITGDQQYCHVADLGGHDGPVWEISWAHPKFGVLLASCSYDQRVIIHREAAPGQWQQIMVNQDLQSSVNSLSWAPHEYDLCLACASSDGKVAVLTHNQDDSWSTTLLQDSQLGVNAVTWAPYGALGSTVEGNTLKRIATGACDNCVRVWVLREGETEWQQEHVLQGHTDWVRDVAWAPSTGLPCNTMASCSEDGTVFIWSQDQVNGQWRSVQLPNFDKPVWRVSWSLTGNVLAVSSGDSKVTLWKESLDRSWVSIGDVNDSGAQPVAQQ